MDQRTPVAEALAPDLPCVTRETLHLDSGAFQLWLDSARDGEQITYAYGTLAKSAGATGELSALREAAQRAAQAGQIVLVTKTHSPPDTAKPQCRAFEYIAVRLAGKNNPPAWKSDWGTEPV